MVTFLIITYALQYLRHAGRRLYGILAAVVLVGALLAVALPYLDDSGMGRRLSTTFGFFTGTAGREESGSERIELIKESARLFFRHPITGVGMSNFEFVSGMGMYPHNNYGVIFAETGIVGAVLYFTPLLWALRRLTAAVRAPNGGNATAAEKAYCLQLLACLAGFFAYGMFQGNWRSKSAVCLLGMVFGAVIMLNRKRNYAALDGPHPVVGREYESYA